MRKPILIDSSSEAVEGMEEAAGIGDLEVGASIE
jgi:hypothetical protein